MIEPARLTSKAESILRQAGWNPERQVSTEAYEALYAREGLTVFPEALEVLRSFGGIEVGEPFVSRFNAFGFDPVQALSSHDPEQAQPFEDSGSPLCLVGACDGSMHPLYVVPSGEVCILTHMGELVVVGNNIMEAIEDLVNSPAY